MEIPGQRGLGGEVRTESPSAMAIVEAMQVDEIFGELQGLRDGTGNRERAVGTVGRCPLQAVRAEGFWKGRVVVGSWVQR